MFHLGVAPMRLLAQKISPSAFTATTPVAEKPSAPPSTNNRTREAVEPRDGEISVTADRVEATELDYDEKALEDVPRDLTSADSNPVQNRNRVNTKVSNEPSSDPVDDVPVLLSVKVLHGNKKGSIYYHYFFHQPPFWELPRHGIFEIIGAPLLPLDEKRTKTILLDRDVGRVFFMAKKSITKLYGGGTAVIDLGPGKWLKFVTDYDGSEIPMDTTLRKLIYKFLKSEPVAGSPFIITPIESYESLGSYKVPGLELNQPK